MARGTVVIEVDRCKGCEPAPRFVPRRSCRWPRGVQRTRLRRVQLLAPDRRAYRVRPCVR